MNLVKRSSMVVGMTVCIAAGTCVGQSRIQLVQGRRVIQDRVSFVIEGDREKTQNPRYAEKSEDMRVSMRFAERAEQAEFISTAKLSAVLMSRHPSTAICSRRLTATTRSR